MALISLIHVMLLVQSEQRTDLVSQGTEDNGVSNYFFWGSVILNIAFILIIIYREYKSRSKIENIENEHKEVIISYAKESSRRNDERTKNQRIISQLKTELSNLRLENTKNDTAEKRFEEDCCNVVELSVENTDSEPSCIRSSGFETTQVELAPTEYYASCVQVDGTGYLIIEDKRTHKSPYKILELNGKYSYDVDSYNQDALRNALNFYNIYINPFCIPSNTFQDNHTTFISWDDSKGVLEKEGDKFRVVEKIEIKFLER